MAGTSGRAGWILAGVSLLLLALVIGGLYAESVRYLLSVWNDWEMGDYGHGYLVTGISAYMIFTRRRELAAAQPQPAATALLFTGAAGALWLMATLIDVQMFQAVALLGTFVFALASLVGWRIFAYLAYPLAMLLLAVPVWSLLSPLLQGITADAVFTLSRLFDLPALRQENDIVLPAGRLAIEEACSGLRFLLAAITLGATFAYLNYASALGRLSVIAVSVAGAVAMNIVRVMIVVYLAYKSDMQHPMVHDHLSLGWYLFAALVVVLLMLDYALQRWRGQAGPGGERRTATQAADAHAQAGPAARQMSMLAVSLLLVAVPPSLMALYNRPGDSPEPRLPFEFPAAQADWQGPYPSDDDWWPVYPGAQADRRVYRYRGEPVYLYIAYYPRQRQGAELINDLNLIADNKVWRTESRSAVSEGTDTRGALAQAIIAAPGERRLVYYWYDVAGQRTASRYMAKLLQLAGLLRGDRRAALFALATPVSGGDFAAPRLRLEDFLARHPLSLARLVNDNGTQ